MSVSEKLTAIAENVRRVFFAGHAAGYDDGIKQSNQASYEKGVEDERDRFWNAYQENGTRTNYNMAFAYRWTDAIFQPKYDIAPAGGTGVSMFQYTLITDLKNKLDSLGVKLDLSECTSITQAFQGAAITHLPELDMSKVTSCGYAFGTKSAIVTIDKIISSEKTVFNVSAFNQAENLRNITFEGVIACSVDVHWSPLSKDSLVSLANVLSPTATATLTVSKAAVSAGFPNRAEWDALFANKPNWTVSEV